MKIKADEVDVDVHTPRGLLVCAADLVTKDMGQLLMTIGSAVLSVAMTSDGVVRVCFSDPQVPKDERVVFERDFSKEAA